MISDDVRFFQTVSFQHILQKILYIAHNIANKHTKISWTELSKTAVPGDQSISVIEAVSWPIGSKIVIATTNFESAMSSHSEVCMPRLEYVETCLYSKVRVQTLRSLAGGKRRRSVCRWPHNLHRRCPCLQ